MDNKHQYKFIEGDFSTQEAKTVLMAVINSKISYHNLDTFSDLIRFNGNPEKTKKRVIELNDTKDTILKLLEEAHKNGQSLRIKSDITIELL